MSDSGTFVERMKGLDYSSGVSVGLVRACSLAISLFALASIVFIGELQVFVLSGTGMFFVGTAILCLFLALFGKFPAPVATTPIPVALVMIAIAQSIDLQGREYYLAFAFSIIGCAFLTGVFFLVIGYCRFANFFRFVPYTVSAGALAGSGILILLMALRLIGLDWKVETWSSLLEPLVFWNWFLGVSMGVVFIVAIKIWKHFWIMPLLFAVFCGLFHVGLIAMDMSIVEATASGLFLNADWSAALWPTVGLDDVKNIPWAVVVSQAVNGTVLFLVLLVLTVVSFAQLELGADMEFDWNKEFKLHGVANLLSGVGGGVPGAMVASSTLPHIALRANTPVTSFVIAIFLLLMVFFGSEVLRLMPLAATSAFLISVAVPLIDDWLIRSRKRLHVTEYGMLVLICMTIVFVGFLHAIALGLVLSLVFFAVRLSQVSLVDEEYSIARRQSRTLRSIPDQAIVKVYGSRARVFRLRGYVFFGSAHTFANLLKESLNRESKPSCVVIDFAQVSGFDLSALDSLRGYMQQANVDNVATLLSSTSDRLKREIQQDLPPDLSENLIWEESEESALVAAEELLLKRYEEDVASDPSLRDLVRLATTADLTDYLDRQVEFESLLSNLSDRFETIEYEDQDSLTTAGEPQEGMQLLISGRANARSTVGTVLYECEPGAIIEGRSAIESRMPSVSIIAQGPCRTLLVTREGLEKLDAEDSELALKLYRYTLAVSSSTSSQAFDAA